MLHQNKMDLLAELFLFKRQFMLLKTIDSKTMRIIDNNLTSIEKQIKKL